MPGIDKILCTIDFSEHTAHALNCAVGISRAFDADLVVYHSIFSPKDPNYGTTDFERGSDLEKKRTGIRKALEDLMVDCPVRWEAVISIGDPVVQLAGTCRRLGVDLVVAASHGISGFRRVFLGTVVERMARRLNSSMLVVRRDKEESGAAPPKPFQGFGKIMAGCDFKEDSIPSIRQALAFAKAFRASLHLLHVMESPVHEEMVDLTEAPYGEVQQKLAVKMEERLHAMLPVPDREGLQFHASVAAGIPAEEIVHRARELEADLIVVGVRSHKMLDQIVIGPSTELVLRRAPCAVMTVPVPEAGAWKSRE